MSNRNESRKKGKVYPVQNMKLNVCEVILVKWMPDKEHLEQCIIGGLIRESDVGNKDFILYHASVNTFRNEYRWICKSSFMLNIIERILRKAP